MSHFDIYSYETSCRYNVPLSNISWFRCGGDANILWKPNKIDDLIHFCLNFEEKDKIHIIGACSNIIIRDGGVRGVVIKLGSGFSYINQLAEKRIEVGCATLDSNVASFCADNGISGFEFLVGIPGTIGGNIRSNAGCYGREISDVLERLYAIDTNGVEYEFNKDDIGFSYRRNSLPHNMIFTKVIMRGNDGNSKDINDKMNLIKRQRESSQPIREKTSGSTFVNPSAIKAWELIDRCGLRGIRVGNAQMSNLHCNFMINNGNTSAAELEALGELVRSTVKREAGIELCWEIDRIGSYVGLKVDDKRP